MTHQQILVIFECGQFTNWRRDNGEEKQEVENHSSQVRPHPGRNERLEQGDEMTLTKLDQAIADAEQGNWYPACGGTETVFTSRAGHRLLYCWQPRTGRHAYINTETDIILSDDEARASLGTF